MSSSTICFLILGVLLTITQLSSCQSWGAFKAKHVTSASTINCKEELKYPLFTVHRQCKEKNTFIHASTKSVENICRGVAKNKFITSSTKFKLTFCKEEENCEYKVTKYSSSVVCVKCEKKKPVHFHKIGKC